MTIPNFIIWKTNRSPLLLSGPNVINIIVKDDLTLVNHFVFLKDIYFMIVEGTCQPSSSSPLKKCYYNAWLGYYKLLQTKRNYHLRSSHKLVRAWINILNLQFIIHTYVLIVLLSRRKPLRAHTFQLKAEMKYELTYACT